MSINVGDCFYRKVFNIQPLFIPGNEFRGLVS